MKYISIVLFFIFTINGFGQEKDSLVGSFFTKNYKDYKIYKNISTKKYFLKDENGKLKFQNFNYITNLSNQYLQCLNRSNSIIYLNGKLKKVSKPKIKIFIVKYLVKMITFMK